MNKNNNHHLISTPTSSSLQKSTMLPLLPDCNNTFCNYSHSNIYNHPMNNLKDSFQYPYTNNDLYGVMNDKNEFSLQYNRSEKVFGLQPEVDLELKRQISDSFLYLYSPFMNIDYIPLSSSSNPIPIQNPEPDSMQLLEKKRLRDTKSNNSPLSTDIDNSNNNKGLVMSSDNNTKDSLVFPNNDILNIQPMKISIPISLTSAIISKRKQKEKNKQKDKANKDESVFKKESLWDQNNILQSPDKNIALTKTIVKNNHKRNNHLLKEIELYKDEEYYNDLDSILKNNSKHQFMHEHFPNAYTKLEVMNNIKKLNEKRRLKAIFIAPKSLRDKNIFISNPIKYECDNKNIPKKIWAPDSNMIDNDYSSFYNKIEQQWPFEKCPCVIEHILEYLIINDYSQENCLKEVDDCVRFVNEKVSRVLIDGSASYKGLLKSQRKKKYNLRDRKGSK